MPQYIVTTADGRKVRVTTRKEATQAELQAAVGGGKDTRPTSFVHGFKDEWNKATANFQRLQQYIPFMGGPNPNGTRNARMIDTGRQRYNATAPTRPGFGGQLAAGTLASLPTAVIPGGPLVQGGFSGLLLSNNLSDPKTALIDFGVGAAGGKAGEWLGKYVVSPVVRRAANSRPVRAAIDATRNVARRGPSAPPPRLTKPERVIAPKAPEVRAKLEDAQGLGLPYALVDADPNLRAVGGSATRFSPNARTIATDTLSERTNGQNSRATRFVRENFAPYVDVRAKGDELVDLANDTAGPLYAKANQGGSTAPLQTQLENAFRQTSGGVATAQAELNAARQALTLSKARVNRAGNNVYQNAQALPVDRQAEATVAAAEARLAGAQRAHQQTLEMLRVAQGDAAANAPGAIWSPRIQQFLDDPISRQGLAQGLETQRIEALAAGRPFDPTEFAVTGFNEAGEPIVAKVPNMRTLNAMKMGYDRILESDKVINPKTGRLNQYGRAVTQAKNALLDELDQLNPEYAAARETYGGVMSGKSALDQGFEAPAANLENYDLQRTIAGFKPSNDAILFDQGMPSQLDLYRTGYASGLRKQINSIADTRNPYVKLRGSPDARENLATLFPESAPRLERQNTLESDIVETTKELFGGSQTQPRAISDAQFSGGLSGDVGEAAATTLMTGSPGMGAGNFVMNLGRRTLRNVADRKNLGMLGAQRKADELAPVLFNTDPAAAIAMLDSIAAKKAAEEYQKRAYAEAIGRLGLLPGSAAATLALPAFIPSE